MGKVAYRESLRDPRWQKLRLQILERDGWRCLRCGTGEKTLNVHHKHYQAGLEPWEYPAASLETICEDCHAAEHGKGEPALLPPPPPPIPSRLKARLQKAVDTDDLGAERMALAKIRDELQRRHGVV